MISVVIIEDERLVANYINDLLKEIDRTVSVASVISSVAEGIDFFQLNSSIDLILSDVQLPDGLSFTIFQHLQLSIPVIFITAYDKFITKAFEANGIHYLLKPVNKQDLQKALDKYYSFARHFSTQLHQADTLLNSFTKKRSRIVGRKGKENILIPHADIVLFFTENKVSYVVDNNGNKYFIDKTLSEMEQELNPEVFFRANRQYIINLKYIRSFKSYERVKLLVGLNVGVDDKIIISQETAPAFRKWITEV